MALGDRPRFVWGEWSEVRPTSARQCLGAAGLDWLDARCTGVLPASVSLEHLPRARWLPVGSIGERFFPSPMRLEFIANNPMTCFLRRAIRPGFENASRHRSHWDSECRRTFRPWHCAFLHLSRVNVTRYHLLFRYSHAVARAGQFGSMRIAADHLAAVAGREGLVDTLGARKDAKNAVGVAGEIGREYPVDALYGQELMVSLRNRTEPSTKEKFAPPGWKLDAAST